MNAKMRYPILSFVASSLLVLSGCSQLSSEQNKAANNGLLAENLGCLQGVILNGLTRDGVDLLGLTSEAGSGVRAMVGGTAVAATPAASFLGNSSRSSGEYSICNIPLDERYNLVVDLPGFQRVEGLFLIESTLATRSAEPSQLEINKRVPTEIVNIIVYPIGVQTADLKFEVTHEGKPLSDARVQLLSTGKNKLDAANNYALTYTNMKSIPLALNTDKEGHVTFNADSLVLGATYEYRVFPPVGSNSRGFTKGEFTLGLVDNAISKGLPYIVQVELNEILPDLKIHSQNATLAANGYSELELIFNRPVELLFDTQDDIRAALSLHKNAELLKDIPGNGKSEQVSISISGNRVVLQANYLIEPDATIEPGMRVTFSGLNLKATDDEGTMAKWAMPAPMTIDVFAGVNQKPVPSKLALESSISSLNHTGPADMELQRPLAVTVLDQFGDPVVAGVKVIFEAKNAFGQGTLRSDTGSSSYKIEVLTDSNGVAKAFWRLPKIAGTYEAQASIVNIATVNFSATATDWVKTIVTSTLSTTAVISTELAAFTVQLYNQADKIWQNESRILISTGSGSGKVRTILMTPDYAVPSLDTKTDANGNMSLVWTLGATVGNQQLTIAIPGSAVYKVFSVAATATATPGQ
jgi:hypothetical protein